MLMNLVVHLRPLLCTLHYGVVSLLHFMYQFPVRSSLMAPLLPPCWLRVYSCSPETGP